MMKRIAIIAMTILLLASCSTVKHEAKWYSDFTESKKVATACGLNILLLVNSDMDTTDSREGVKLLLEGDFVNTVKDKFVCVHFDFTDLKAKMAQIPEDSTADEQKNAEKNKSAMMAQFNIADAFGVTSTPQVVIASKEGYYICTVDFDWTVDTIEPYMDKLEEMSSSITTFIDQIQKTKKGSVEERVAAIDAIYDAASESQRLLLIPLYDEVLSIDKKNVTGKVSKYITAKANAQGHAYILNKNVDKAIETYEKAATDKRIAADDKQMLYYIAANLLGNAQTGKTDKIIELLEKSIAASPSSDYVTNLQQLLDYVKQMAGIQVEPAQSNDTNTEVSGEEAAENDEEAESLEERPVTTKEPLDVTEGAPSDTEGVAQ